MSMKTIMRGALVACCAALGLNAWAADIQITNVGTIVHPSGGTIGTNQGQYPVAGLRISADDTLGIANGEILKIKKIAIAYNTSGTNTATHHLQLNGVNSAEKTTDATMAIGNESVATYVFESDVYAVVGATMPMLALNDSGVSTLFRCRVYDHQSAEQHFQRSAIVTSSHYAGTNWGAMYRIVAEKVPSYAKGSLNAYLNKNSAQTLIPGAKLADISKGWIVGKVNGGYVSSSFKDTLIYPFNVTEVKDPETQELTAVKMQFQLQEGRALVKTVLAECTETAAGVVIKATDAKVNQSNDHYGEDASSWDNADVATSATAGGYGIHDLSFLVLSTSITVTESKTWAEIGATPITGETVTVLVDPAATITFAEGDSVAGFQFMSTSENDGVSISGVIPSGIVIVGDEILSGTATISNFATSEVTVNGAVTMTADINIDGNSVITLNNGSLTGGDSARLHAIGNASIIANGTASISNLWMGGSGNGVVATMQVAEGGELTLGKIVNSYVHTIVKDGKGVLKVTSNVCNKQVAYQLKDGALVGKESETAITKHSSVAGLVVLASGPDAEGYTTYTLGMKPRTEAATVTMTDWTGTAFTYVDGEETLKTTLIEGDTVVVPSSIADDNWYQWHFTDGEDTFAGHAVEVNKNMNWKWSVGTMTIGTGATVYLFNTYGLNDGAVVTGEGTLSVNGVDVPVKGAATISCTTIAFVGGNFKLTTADSTLTCAKLDEGEEITKVVSGVDGKHVEYSDGKYVLVDDKTPTELFLEGIAAGGDVELTGAVTLDAAAVIPADKTVTLDLNGCTITAPKTVIEVLGTLTVKDTGTNGKIVSTDHCGIVVGDGATLTVNSGIIESVEGAIITGKSVGAKITIKGGTFSASDNAVIAGNGTKREGDRNTIMIHGGTFNGTIKSAGYIACGIYAPWKDVILVDGGTFNITGGCGVCARAGTVEILATATINLINEGTVSGWVGDNKNAVPGVQVFFDYAAKYPALTEGDALLSDVNTFTIAETQEWVDASPRYKLVDKSTGPKEWTDVTESTTLDQVVPAEQVAALTAAGATATQVAAWATKVGINGKPGVAIDLDAFALNCSPSAKQQTVEDEVPSIDMTELAKGDLTAAVKAISDKYPLATVQLVEATLPEGTVTTAKLYKLVISLK